MRRAQNYIAVVFLSLAFLGSCGFLSEAPVRDALDAAAPQAIESLTRAVLERWGPDAELDEESAQCFELKEVVFELFDDDDNYVHSVIVCRVMAK